MFQLEYKLHGSSYFHSTIMFIAVAGRRVNFHRRWPLRGTTDGNDSNRRPEGECVVYKMSFILVYIKYYINLSYSNTEGL